MKKLIGLLIALALLSTALSGCRRRPAEEAPEATPTPEPAAAGMPYTVVDEDETPSVPDPLATLTPQERAAITVGGNGGDVSEELLPPGGELEGAADQSADTGYDPGYEADFDTYDEAADEARMDSTSPVNASAYQFSAVMDENVDFTFNYTSDWENVPGIYTVCFRQKVDKGMFPARVAVSRKKLVHTPDEIVMNEQMTSYIQNVAKQYDPETFQIGTPSNDEIFIRRKAVSNTYLAFWGTVEVKGYIIGVAVDRTLYVLHFCAAYGDYAALDSVRQYIVNSVQLYDDPKDRKKK